MKPLMTQWNLKNKRVIVRIDGNVPLEGNKIIDDYRLVAVKPTIDYLLEHGAHVILLTHLGEPEKRSASLSAHNLMPWFKRFYDIAFAPTLQSLDVLSKKKSLVLFENTRFFKSEKSQSKRFAHELAQHADYYVNDAFSAMHRSDTSLLLLAQQFDANKRSYGFLTARELEALNPLLTAHKNTLVMLGGAKLDTKIPLITHLRDAGNTVAVLPALSFTFTLAQGYATGKSLVDKKLVPLCKTIMQQNKNKDMFILPGDYQVAQKDIKGALSYTPDQTIPAQAIGIAIGPKTVALLEQKIHESSLIFFNGLMGFEERKETLEATKQILIAMSKAKGTTIIAGGDTVAYAHQQGLAQKMDYVSTGGGATMTYLSGQPLPALDLLLKQGTKS